ncbi:hypothetical protein [Bacteroides sp. 51]|uniref:hypothetical protein n=1 Tax=Bacteroides sp. 51 TaxID=2302938 RepID=UPI0013CFA6D3|nr:hypothetical protein [Bacteroides sp. 51]NDV81310.1 hypothetical protein [Bacteroides sp. 51]
MEAKINILYEWDKVEIYLKEGRHFFMQGKKGGINIVESPADGSINQEIKPFLTIPGGYATHILKALSDASKGIGISTENENLLKGKLQATETHLSDMREIAMLLIKRGSQDEKI